MKLQYKISIILILFGSVVLVPLSYIYMKKSEQIILNDEVHNLRHSVDYAATHIDSILKYKARLAFTMESAPIIQNAIINSNMEFSKIQKNKREEKINELNNRWKNSQNTDDPFILKYTNNEVADYLKLQQKNFPDTYGEIFLTNRYGALIASTGKLSTLAHGHKYWWQASYNNGQGKIFFDDRGFDKSVKGYVLGVVIPIKRNNEVIGILKCNINIKDLLYGLIEDYTKKNQSVLQIVRTKGLIIAKKGVEPLSSKIDNSLLKYLNKKDIGSAIINHNGKKELIAYKAIGITTGSKKYGFGGKYKSFDQLLGNEDEAWHTLISCSLENTMAKSENITYYVVMVAVIFIILIGFISALLGKLVANPVERLSEVTKAFGSGNLKVRSNINSKDELEDLAKSFNDMAHMLETREHKLNQSSSLLENIINSIPIRVFWKDKDGKYIGANDAFLKDAKLEKSEDIIGKTDLELIWGNTTAELYMEDDKKIMQNGKAKLQYEEHIILEDGSIMFITTSKVPLRDEENKIVGILGVYEDITQRKISENKIQEQNSQLIQQSKMASMGEMIGMIAHQWRQPLSAISSSILGMQIKLELNKFDLSSNKGQKELKKFLNTKFSGILGYVEFLSTTIDDFRSFFKPDKKKESVNIEDLIKGTILVIKSSLKMNGINLKKEYASTKKVLLYRNEVMQVILNILQNAKDVLVQREIIDPNITIKTKDTDDGVAIEIYDNGGGIEEEIIDKIFDPYFSTKDEKSGTGIGLYMSKTIIEKHCGGSLSVKNSDEGTCFCIEFKAIGEI